MAIAITEPVAELASTASTTTYDMTAFTPTAGSLLVLWTYVLTPASGYSITNTGTTLTWVEQGSQTFGGDTIYCFTAQVPASVSSTIITYNNATAPAAIFMMLQEVTGHSTYTPKRQINFGSGTATTVTVSVASALLTANGVSVGIGIDNDLAFGTLSGGFTKTADQTVSGPTSRAGAWSNNSGLTGTSYTMTISQSRPWGFGILEIWEADSGPYQPYSQFLIFD